MIQPHSALFMFTSNTRVEHMGYGPKRWKLGYNNKLMAVKSRFAPGAEGYVDAHRHAQTSLTLQSEFRVRVKGETKVWGARNSFFVRPNEDHGAVCPTGGILIENFSPARENFPKE